MIPTAKPFQHKGKDLIAVPHRLEEVRVLRNLGIEAPSPIKYHYAWPGRFAPFSAQRDAAAFLTINPRAFNLSEMGTGKSLASLWAYDYLREKALAQRLLIIGPLSTLERTWADEVFQHFPHLTTSVVYGSSDRRIKLLGQDVDIYIINHDGIKIRRVLEALDERPDIDLVVIDEISQMARNFGTDRYKALHRVMNGKVKRNGWGLTGTPTPNEPTDAWAQCRILVPSRVPPYHKRFKDLVMRQVGPYLWVPRDNAADVVHEAMQPSIRFTRSEMVDLPPTTFETREVEMTPQQDKAYKEMMLRLKAEADEGHILAVNEAVKAQKLIQIACGVAYDNNGGEAAFDVEPRLKVVREIIDGSSRKVIVFVPFVSVINMVAADLMKHNISTEIIHGGVSKAERDRIFHEFQKCPEPRVIVAQPAAMSHGLTLTAANTIVWYAPITSTDTYLQANARIVRPGQTCNTLIVMIQGTPIERKYYQRLVKKEKVQGTLLDLVQESRLTSVV